jgi:hypothetical protein
LYNMERSRVVESPHFSILQPNLAKKRNVSLFHAQINVLIDKELITTPS